MFGKADWGQHRDAGRYLRHIVTMTRCASARRAHRLAPCRAVAPAAFLDKRVCALEHGRSARRDGGARDGLGLARFFESARIQVAGLIVADAYGAMVLREAPEHRLAPATRRAMLLRFAQTGADRLHDLADPERG